MGAPRCIVPTKSDNGKAFVVGTLRNCLLECDNAFSGESNIKYLNQVIVK